MHPAVAQSLLVRRKTPLKPFLIGSFAAHVGFVVLVFGYSWLALPPPIDLNQKPIQASLVRLGKPRDENLLPRKEELPPPPEKSERATQEVPLPVPAEKAVAVPIPGVKAKETKSAKQAGETDGTGKRSRLFDAMRKASKSSADDLEGALDGDPSGDSARAEGERYYGLLKTHVQRNYDVSQAIPDQERIRLKAQVLLQIGRTGELIRVKLASPSDNPLFNNAVLAAVKKASPFAPPPDHLRDSLQRVGVVLEFRP